jgi:eukaryotic-like serine/threonine-protein kinase
MTASRPDNEAIFHAARDIPDPDRRRQYVREACGRDEVRIALVEALLAAADGPDSLLDRPAADTLAATIGQPTAESAGTVIGPYKLLEQIGDGGMGSVWMAQQTEPVKRLVAVKLIKAGMDSRQVIARFEAERQALALMDHPNIARVLDGGTTGGGRPYFVMDLVKGVPITRYCDEHHLTPRQRLELFIPVCQAVQHAHQKGIIHRDLKPTNVLVALYDGNPVPKIIDFGVAKAAGQQLTDKTLVTGFGAIVGTLEYMSPEQAEVNQLDIDTRSDIYSLGVLLYELLTGSPPFSRKELEKTGMLGMLRVIREQEPTKPSTKLSTADGLPTLAANRGTEPGRLTRLVRGELDWIVMKTLEKDRSRRYETANGLAMDVQRYLADEPVQAGPPSAGYRLRKFARRHKGPVLAGLLILLALVAGVVGTTWGMIWATGAQAVAVSEANQKEAALKEAQQSERDAREQLFLALWNQARAGRLSRQMGQRLDTLDALSKAAGIRPDERLRDEAIAALALPDVRRVPGWRSAPPDTVSVAYGAQYRLYARADARGVISIRSIPDDQEIQRIASGPILGTHLLFSPDDRFLLGLGNGHTLHVWRIVDGQPALRDQPRDCHGHAFSPDGRRLAVSQQDWVLLFDLATGQEVQRWRVPAQASMLAFHPSGAVLAVGYFGSRGVSVYHAANGTLLTDLPVGQITEQLVAWHPDGRRLAVTGSDPRIQIWDVAAARKLATLEGHVQRVNALTFHPDGELLASHGWDGQLLLWDPSSSRLVMRLTSSCIPQFSADGRRLGVAWKGDRADFLEVTPSREYRTLVNSAGPGPGGYDFGDISPDGRVLVVGIDSGARLWDLRSGRELAALPEGTPYVVFEGKGRGEGDPATPNRPSWNLLTSGAGGLRRWPVTSDDPEGKRLSLGSPQQLSLLERAFFGRSPDGRTLAAVTVEGGTNQILELETGAVRRELGPHPAGEVRALSGDGRWAASSGWHSDRVWLWNVGTGEKVKEWVVGKQTHVFFTPDSRALIISRGEEFSFWDVETFQLIRRLPRDVTPYPGWVAFSADGRLMALEMAPGVLYLKEAATGRTVARLEDPHGDRATWLGFTPDGTKLVVVSSFASAVHVRDLRAIRTRLKEMNLDWDWPAFPPAATGDAAGAAVTVEVIRGDQAEATLTPEERARKAIEHWRRELEAHPESATLCNRLAWTYLTVPEPLRDVKAAVRLAEKAVQLAPATTSYRNTLGMSYYRAGRYREAVETLRPNLERPEEQNLAFDLYFLAMSCQRLGETVRARDFYTWAVRWTGIQPGLQPGQQEQLNLFRAEAAEVLGIDRKKD